MILSVTRIDCVTCSLAIEKQIKKLKGIEDIKTSVMLNKIYIDYDSHIIDSEQIRRAVDKTGYKRYMTIEEKR